MAGSERSKCKGPEVKCMVVRKARRVMKLERSERGPRSNRETESAGPSGQL